ncbi:MAG: hypothetical protein RL336_509, partial [Pseudomonadota bacterium]
MHDDQNQQDIRILVIDDDALVRQSVADYLTDSGYLVDVASDGKKGLALFEALHPDLIICDLRMPEMDGLNVLRIL